MPLLRYLADTNALSDVMRGEKNVVAWFDAHPGEIALSTITLAEMRAGIELKPAGKRRRELERDFNFIFEDYAGGLMVFDEAAAFEWGRLMAEAKNRPLPYDDSLIAAIARSVGLRVVTRNVNDFPACPTVDPWTGIEYAGWPGS
jgi:predicted nucleic acid-binding protein